MFKYMVLTLAVILAGCGGTIEKEPTLEPQAAQGSQVFRTHCATCHTVTGDRVVVGPALAGIAERATTRVEGLSAEDYLYESILSPNTFVVEGFVEGSMQQNFGDMLTLDEINQVVAYLLTLE